MQPMWRGLGPVDRHYELPQMIFHTATRNAFCLEQGFAFSKRESDHILSVFSSSINPSQAKYGVILGLPCKSHMKW